MRGKIGMKKKLIILFIMFIVVLGVMIYMKINNNNNDIFLEINVNNENETFNYDETTNLEYNELKNFVFLQDSIELLNNNYPIKYLKEKNNIYYTIYSLKDNKLCYIIFKEVDKKLYIDYSWVYSKEMVDANQILNIEIGTKYDILDSIDRNIQKIDELSSQYYTIHFLKDGRTAMLDIDKYGRITKAIVNNNIFDIIYNIDYPEKIIK